MNTLDFTAPLSNHTSDSRKIQRSLTIGEADEQKYLRKRIHWQSSPEIASLSPRFALPPAKGPGCLSTK